ncbi:hypothetical protein MMC07_009272 [Pseudocyphellaria aurata]|nr:hypothetical protein [Pseudocyphellaria aurata]
MKISNHSAVPVYTISGSSTARPLPEWLARKRKRSLKNDPEYANRIELLQDFEYEEASQCVRVSDDGQWVMSTGASVLHTISENKTFVLLSSDYTKSVHLQADRSIEIHTPQGCHYTTRLPRYGRDMIYDRRSAEALVPAAGVNENGNGEVFRLNLEAGRYMRGYEIDVGGDDVRSSGGGSLQGGIGTGSVNTAAVAEDSHNLLAFGTSLGTVEFWDPRTRDRAGILTAPAQADFIDGRFEVTALQFDRSGLGLATGSSTGLIHLYDLRSSAPILKKDQGYGYPIQTLIFLASSIHTRAQTNESKILSADKRIIKIWDSQSGAPWTSVEPAVDLNSVAWCKDSGMVLTANEGRQQHSFFIPQLGPAPRWCSFLDNLVEEMAEDPNDPNAFTSQRTGEVYDNYKFLTIEQLDSLNLSHLVGTTSLLRPYMHGYFVAQQLYEEARLIADPSIWEERNKRIKAKIDVERESRIRGNKKIVAKVNKRLAEKMMDRSEKNERRLAKRVLEKGGDDMAGEGAEAAKNEPDGLLADPRFAKLFQDEDFAIDEKSREFQLLNPSTKPALENGDSRDHQLTAVEEEALSEDPKSDSDDSSAENEELPIKAKTSDRISSASYSTAKWSGPRALPQMKSSSKKPGNHDRSFGSRAKRIKAAKSAVKTIKGEREVSFLPEKKGGKVPKEDILKAHRHKHDKARRSASGNVFRGL